MFIVYTCIRYTCTCTFFLSVTSQETKERALTLMLLPRDVLEPTLRQNWISEGKWGTTIPTSHSTSSSNSSIASHALSWGRGRGNGKGKGREGGGEGGGREGKRGEGEGGGREGVTKLAWSIGYSCLPHLVQ